MTQPTCETCSHGKIGYKAVECRRYPPQIFCMPYRNRTGDDWFTDYESVQAWPSMSPKFWCGEHQPYKQKEPEE
jgi:hypothetical protein